jgi:hypothetical protein
MNWQTYTALAIVGITLTIFIYCIFSRKNPKPPAATTAAAEPLRSPELTLLVTNLSPRQ